MNNNQLLFVSFEPIENNYKAYLSLSDFIYIEQDYEKQLEEAISIYKKSIKKMNTILEGINQYKKKYRRLPAQKIWQLGDSVFELQNNLKRISLQLDGLYYHLVRDLDVKKKWLEKVIIFRRYIPDKDAIPESLNWGKCEKSTRRVAEELYRKFNLNKDV